MAGVRFFFLPSLIGVALALAGSPSHAAAVDAQEACVAPAQAFSAELDETAASSARRDQFIDLVRACQVVYLNELRQVEQRYARLPESSHCREMSDEFREALQTLTRIERTAAELPLASDADREAALAFYRLAAPGLTRAVNGLFILHYGVCQEEARAGLAPTPSSNATISDPDEARGRL